MKNKTPEWIERLKQCSTVPTGYHSVVEISQMCGVSRYSIATKLKKLFDKGEIKRVSVLVEGKLTNYYGK